MLASPLLLLVFPAAAEEPAAEPTMRQQSAVITGAVEGFGTGRPLAGAIVEVRQGGVPMGDATTDEHGRFSLAVPLGELEVGVRHPAWQRLTIREEVRRAEVLEVVYRLRPPPSDMEIEVVADRERVEVSRQVFTAEELRRVPGAFGDPVRALQSLPGVARSNVLEGNLVVRGAEGINTGFYVDEMPVPYLFHLLLGKSVIDPAFVDDVEFYAGGMPSRFGEVTQGAVNVRTDREPVSGRRSLVDLNLLDGGGAVEWSGDDWTARAAGRYSWVGGTVGLVSGLVVVGQGGDFDEASYTYPRYWDGFLSFQRRRPGGELSATLLLSRDALVVHEGEYDGDGDGEPDPPEWEEWDLPYDPDHLLEAGFVRGRLRWKQQDGQHHSDTWVAAGPQTQMDLLGDVFGSRQGPYLGRVRGVGGVVRREDRWNRSERVELLQGAQLTLTRVEAQDFSSVWETEGRDIPTTEDTQVSAGAYQELQWKPDPWMIGIGLRESVYAFNDDWYAEPEPRLTLRRAAGDALVAKAFVGRFTQMPPIEVYAQGIGNPELPLMTAWQAAAGAEWSRGPWMVDSSLYASRMQHLAVRELVATLRGDQWGIASVEVEPTFLDVLGRAYGWEGLLRWRPQGPWWGWAALTVGRSERIGDDRAFPGDYDQPVALTLLAAYSAPRRWALSARVRLTSGHPYTPYSGVYDPYLDYYAPLPGETNSARFPWFRQLDLRAEKTWGRSRGDWTLYIDVFNATWARNPFAAQYNYDYGELLTVLSVPLVPTVGVQARF